MRKRERKRAREREREKERKRERELYPFHPHGVIIWVVTDEIQGGQTNVSLVCNKVQ